ncbi:hypothetical protein SNEBB_008325 [Seison nebaliae]|nr:hypothetical protein SNEBB_008325 [Seison nebaliae]
MAVEEAGVIEVGEGTDDRVTENPSILPKNPIDGPSRTIEVLSILRLGIDKVVPGKEFYGDVTNYFLFNRKSPTELSAIHITNSKEFCSSEFTI